MTMMKKTTIRMIDLATDPRDLLDRALAALGSAQHR
jgi:hypothetical protein